MTQQLPQVTRVYQHHSLDSTRWEHFTPRDDDTIISTAYKSGTTWTQLIMKHLLVPDMESEDVYDFSPWLDVIWNPIEEVIARLEAQTHRRCIKSHLALDGLPYYPQVKYIIVGRDARDVFMSFWNHYSNFTDTIFEHSENTGTPLPRPPEDIHQAWHDWITRGWFDWESEGYPFWGNLHHTQTFWDYKHLPNILFVHYGNLLRDPYSEIRRIVDYAQIDVTDERIDRVVELTRFDNVRKNSDAIVGTSEDFKGGSKTFINKGTNGRWRDVLSEEELALYNAAVERVLTPDCAHWLETGELPES